MVGDLHGKAKHLEPIVKSAEERGIKYIIQVGDFGFKWPDNQTKKMDDYLANRDSKVQILTPGGNHEIWSLYDQLQREQDYPDKMEVFPNCYWVKRGAVLDLDGISHLFFGGAESTNKTTLKENFNWWAREDGNQEEFDLFAKNLNELKPRVVVTHDAPLRVHYDRIRRKKSITPNQLEKILSASSHYPDKYFNGHHHSLNKRKISGIEFYDCGFHGQCWEIDY
jgi:Icc-related predicted phosphoesterase